MQRRGGGGSVACPRNSSNQHVIAGLRAVQRKKETLTVTLGTVQSSPLDVSHCVKITSGKNVLYIVTFFSGGLQ